MGLCGQYEVGVKLDSVSKSLEYLNSKKEGAGKGGSHLKIFRSVPWDLGDGCFRVKLKVEKRSFKPVAMRPKLKHTFS